YFVHIHVLTNHKYKVVKFFQLKNHHLKILRLLFVKLNLQIFLSVNEYNLL
ncbi:hypothetical protein A5797_001922, partial [Enterococcus faecalis]